MLRRGFLSVVVGSALAFTGVGCGDSGGGGGPKSNVSGQLTPLPAPGSPGGETTKKQAKPGAGNVAQ